VHVEWWMCVSAGMTSYPPPTAAAAAAGSACVVNSHETFPLGIQFAGQTPHTTA